jgi:hypothetical protein
MHAWTKVLTLLLLLILLLLMLFSLGDGVHIHTWMSHLVNPSHKYGWYIFIYCWHLNILILCPSSTQSLPPLAVPLIIPRWLVIPIPPVLTLAGLLYVEPQWWKTLLVARCSVWCCSCFCFWQCRRRLCRCLFLKWQAKAFKLEGIYCGKTKGTCPCIDIHSRTDLSNKYWSVHCQSPLHMCMYTVKTRIHHTHNWEQQQTTNNNKQQTTTNNNKQ